MKTNERAITLSAPEVRAVLDGSKTQLRRAVKPQPPEHHWECFKDNPFADYRLNVSVSGNVASWIHMVRKRGEEWRSDEPYRAHCSLGAVGSLLWVRETYALEQMYHPMRPPAQKQVGVQYKATPLPKCEGRVINEPPGLDWDCASWRSHHGAVGLQTMYLSSQSMPRWASRLTLQIDSVRVERMQEITESDANAEGFSLADAVREGVATARDVFRYQWDSANKLHPWASNPWVWTVEFRRVLA